MSFDKLVLYASPEPDPECPKSPNGKHSVIKEECEGTWNHNDRGGRQYKHTIETCRFCDYEKCDFTHAKYTGPGWY